MRRIAFALALVIALLGWLATARAEDAVIKKDGTRLAGTIVEETEAYVVILLPDGQRPLVFRSDIKSVERAPEPAPELETPVEAPPAEAPAAPAEAPPPEPPAPPAPAPTNLELPADLPDSVRNPYDEGVALIAAAHDAKRAEDMIRQASEAVNRLLVATKKMRDFKQGHYQLGIAYQLADCDQKARKALDKALTLDPNFFEAMVELGDVLIRMNAFDDALALYDRALVLHPSYTIGLRQRGWAKMGLRRFAEAITDLEKAVAADANDPIAKQLLEQCQAEVKPREWGETFKVVSKHYEVETNVSQEFAQKIADTAEAAYEVYDLIFEAKESRDMKFGITVFANAEQYYKGPPASPPNTGGYFSPMSKKLVLFQYPEWEDTLNVINHEGFHQYLDMYLSGSPQWFNEGHGDLFGFSSYINKKLVLRPNAWRLATIQGALTRNQTPKLSRLLVMSQGEMYNPQMIGIHYAQAWSFVYFLWNYSGGVHRSRLSSYFKRLRAGDDIREAYEGVFAHDIDELESQWKTYTRGLELWPQDKALLERRKKGTGIGE